MKRMLLASTSTVYGSGYLEYIKPELRDFFNGIEEILFIPYARPGGISYAAYTALAATAFEALGIRVKGIHEFSKPKKAVHEARAIFTGGGNTFLLVKTLYEQKLMRELRKEIDKGTLYLGTSAGSNIAGISMKTTNDMPIVYPPDFRTLGAIPLNINPHYLDPDLDSKHKGETRETRIKEFHVFDETPVIGLREGSWLAVDGSEITLKGPLNGRLFRKGMLPVELSPDTRIDTIIS